jgi:5' nucleotidase, deoxy (Pyrimidine), cytosolic type C protein (NT5C)
LRAKAPILGLDVDSTIWNPTPWICEAVHDITGGKLDLESCTTWTHVLDAYGAEAAIEIYTRVLSPDRVREREPYPGSAKVLRDLQQQQGIRIHFITHNWAPEAMTPHLEPWLKKHFGPDIGLTVTVEDKLGILDSLGAFGMVDDRPDTIARVADAGLWAATMIQPWNRELVAERADVYGFENWHEVPDFLPPLPNGANGV